MKPMTMRRFFFIAAKSGVELLRNYGRIASDNDICGNAFGNDGAGGDDGVFANRHAFKDDSVHSDPDVVGNDYRRGANLRTPRAILEEWRDGVRVNDTLGGRERVEIGVCNSDVP